MSSHPLPRFARIALEAPSDEVDVLLGLLFELGATGVEQRDEGTLNRPSGAGTVTLLASFAGEGDADEAVARVGAAYRPHRDDVVGDEWREGWREHFRPFHLTPRIVVRPPWMEAEATDDERVLELDPGRAFGTGLHATTRLVAGVIERLGSGLEGARVLDVGCGSGILALCAIVHGAADARAIDEDPEAAASTRENAERNGMEGRVSADTTDIAAIDGSFALVVANIEARVLVKMADALIARVATGGTLVLSGILRDQVDAVAEAFGGLERVGVTEDGGWVALELRATR